MKPNIIKYITGILRFISYIISMIFGAYGVAILFSSPDVYLVVFSALLITYCVGISTLLVMTNKKFIRENKIDILKKANTTFSILLPSVWFIGCLDVGLISGQEIFSVLLVAICSVIAWFGVSISINNSALTRRSSEKCNYV